MECHHTRGGGGGGGGWVGVLGTIFFSIPLKIWRGLRNMGKYIQVRAAPALSVVLSVLSSTATGCFEFIQYCILSREST